MCPICITTTALVAAGTTSGAGVIGFLAEKVRRLGRQRRELNGSGAGPVSPHKRRHDERPSPGPAPWRRN